MKWKTTKYILKDLLVYYWYIDRYLQSQVCRWHHFQVGDLKVENMLTVLKKWVKQNDD